MPAIAEGGSRNGETEWFPPPPNFNVATNPELGRSCQAKLATQKKQDAPKQSRLGASVHGTLKFGVWGGAGNHFSVFLLSRLFLPGRDSVFPKKKKLFYLARPLLHQLSRLFLPATDPTSTCNVQT